MRVLTVYAHPKPTSFCHALLEAFTQGLADAGHESEVLDLYTCGFNPLYGAQDYLFFANENVPPDVLATMSLQETVAALTGVQPSVLDGKSADDLVHIIRQYLPPDVLEQQARVTRANGLAFIAPIYWMGFPAILKGWLERVFSYGFAYALTEDGWRGNVEGRIPLLANKKALIMNGTFFSEVDYRERGLAEAIRTLIDDWCFKYPGFRQVEHLYFYAPHAVSPDVRYEYLQRAYGAGKTF
jgi:NAD(P)H dehydrogenase (quinone)